jgi:hypothetical protein
MIHTGYKEESQNRKSGKAKHARKKLSFPG